jgi:branched-subunit amino acid transport protein|tara:strand:+ start:106 stop:360 length:255 start_codon:yes stop_codon:yes gene_type:complete
MRDSNFLSLGAKDFLRGLLMAVLTPVFVIVQQSLELGALTFNRDAILAAAVAGALAYVTKNFFTAAPKVAAIVGQNVPVEKDEK